MVPRGPRDPRDATRQTIMLSQPVGRGINNLIASLEIVGLGDENHPRANTLNNLSVKVGACTPTQAGLSKGPDFPSLVSDFHHPHLIHS